MAIAEEKDRKLPTVPCKCKLTVPRCSNFETRSSIIDALKEARKGFFGCYSVCETMKDTKEGYFIM